MGLFTTLSEPFERLLAALPLWQVLLLGGTAFLTLAVAINIVQQLFFYDRNAPPMVFHTVPIVGSAVSYGMDPFKFFFANHEKYGDVFSFMLLGRTVTVCLGTKGNEFILNGKLKDVNAEEIYTPLTTPVFGSDVVYDCPNHKLMEQKKFVKHGLTTEAFRSYVSLISGEVLDFVAHNKNFAGNAGTVDITKAMSELTIYTASRSLQGREVREKFNSTFADLYHDLDMGFSPINFMLSWAPLPHNRARDHAQRTMANLYMDIIKERRSTNGGQRVSGEEDMLWNLMSCSYKDGTKVPDKEAAHMMIALLMAGQHSSSSTSAWILLRLATRPDIQDELLAEQKQILGENLPPLTYENLSKLTLNAKVVKETLRLHAPIHSIMRKVQNPLTIIAETPNSNTKEYLIPTTHTLMSAPGFTSRQATYFPNPSLWEPHRWDEGHNLAYTQMGQEKEEMEDYGYGMISKGASSPYLPFGAGRHRCIGEQFAYVQLGTVLAMLMRYVRLENLEGKTGVVDTDYSSLFSRPMAPAKVKFVRRSDGAELPNGFTKA
ncbi:Eburicol 14-alpha-demethylase [Cyphellophora attinorum]|uniref:sterol 14alpha-demethylase n=1 Tax=Cyphellophora attinorum TaxID=1664694 RepID=A0A0N0NS20_9EURO|nr:Eburicol 14-alpha-demethylase [Phialophora attinorum]KPI45748.1 Eburicol 14-alpha-demethylase [Phialophora attinorum]